MRNISECIAGFLVLETTPRSQTAVMILEAGESSSEKPETHERSDQTLLLLEGELAAEIDGQTTRVGKGDCLIVPAATPHKFTNSGSTRAVTFNVYSPPAYPPGASE